MLLYLLRHGIAEDAAPGVSDADRKLTSEGISRMEQEAKGLVRLGVAPDAILTSPLARARETAEIVARALGREDVLVGEKRLAEGPGIGDVRAIAAAHPGADALMLVGHNPHLSILAGTLCGARNLELKKGGLALVEMETVAAGQGALRWLLPPAVLRELA